MKYQEIVAMIANLFNQSHISLCESNSSQDSGLNLPKNLTKIWGF